MRLQKSAQMETALSGNITQFGGDRAGISRQAALLVAFGVCSLSQVIGTALDVVTIGIKSTYRAGMQARFAVAVETGRSVG